MLAIQPISISNSRSASSSRPAFKGGWDKDSLDNERSFYERQREELDTLINDDHIPEKIKKPFKFFRVLANGAIDGLAVFGSVMMLAGFLKKGSNSQIVNKMTEAIKPMGGKVAAGAGKITELASKLAEKVSNTTVGKKVLGLFKKFASTYKGKKVLVIVRKLLRKASAIFKKILAPVKKMTKDGATKGIATGLGIGSGISGAYEASMEGQDLSALEDEEGVDE